MMIATVYKITVDLPVDKMVGHEENADSDGELGDRFAKARQSKCRQSYWYLGTSIRIVDRNAFHVWLREWSRKMCHCQLALFTDIDIDSKLL